MLVSIIGLAFIVTVAAFLLAASNGQNTSRLASAKVDIATREDALMREILQQTATGMLPGTDGVTGPILNWTNIMTNAVNQLRATTFVDPTELATLPGLTAVIPANMGDTAGTSLGIFQGYNNSEIPFGGTSGLANDVSLKVPTFLDPTPYNPNVQPPLMNWSGNATLSSTTALTYPQEFFLGSQYTGLTSAVTKLSLSNRWARITYPNVRFGYKQPGDTNFIARRVWWRIPVVYQTTQQTAEDQVGVNRYPSVPANYVISVYEIPSQLPISGNANLKIGLDDSNTAWGSGVQVAGSIYGGKIQLFGGTYSGVSSRQQVNVNSAATVGGVPYSNSNFDAVGTREQMALTQTVMGAAPVSVAGNDGKVSLVPVMPGNQFYMSASATPTHWDLYARPYYRCRVRIIISGTNPTLIYSPSATPQMSSAAGAGAISVNVIVLADSSSQPDQILGFLDSAATTTTYSQTSYADAAGTLPPWMTYTSTGTGTASDRNILMINVGTMITALGSPAQLYSIYVGSHPTTEPASPTTASDPGVGITGTNDLQLFTAGLSIVSNQTLYLLDSFNQVATKRATSIYAPDVRYGISGVNPLVGLTGQISVDQASPLSSPTPGSPLSFADADGTSISTSSGSNTFTLTEITDPTTVQMPPITRLTLLFTVEKERTN
jgi:hypothetical protein